MKTLSHDKIVIEQWLKLYNQLLAASYGVILYPDVDSSKPNVDALCMDKEGWTLAIEHTLVQPFESDKTDAARFMQTLGVLEQDPALRQWGYNFTACLKIGAIPNGVRGAEIPDRLRQELTKALPNLPEGHSPVSVNLDTFFLEVSIRKMKTSPDKLGYFSIGRVHPGTQGEDTIRQALKRKVPKLASSEADRRILLLEIDATAGSAKDQYAVVGDDLALKELRSHIDEIWEVNTAALVTEDFISTRLIDPEDENNRIFGFLNVKTGQFK